MRALLFLLMTSWITTLHSQVLIKNVNVVDVERKTILKGYDVAAVDGRIVAVGKGIKYKLPDGTAVVDGTGKFLSPGLIDAHIHFFQSGGLYARPDAIDLRKHRPYDKEIKWVHDNMEDFLRRYLKAGITGVIDVGATANFLAQRDSFTNKWYAPDIKMTGPLLTTWVPKPYEGLGGDSPFTLMKTEEDTREAVRKQVEMRSDFIKIWYIVLDTNTEAGARKNLHLVAAAIDEAHKNNKRVAVHATEEITARLAVEAGADFLVHNVEDRVISDDFVQLLKKNKTVVSPTIIVRSGYSKALGDQLRFDTKTLGVVNPFVAASLIDYPFPDTLTGKLYMKGINSVANAARERSTDSICNINLMKLYKGGVRIATGTDAGNIGTQHVASYFEEIEAMKKVGISNWDLLQASTINGAFASGTQAERGSIGKGKTADMVLLNGNPADSISSFHKPLLVIRKGKPISPDTLVHNTPEMLAQEQLNAYNAHDLEAFLVPYSEDVEIYEFPDKLQAKGKDEMRKQYAFLKNAGRLYCKLLNRMVQGNMVIDHEEILGVPGSPHYGVAIYEIENGKIKRVYFPK